MKKAYYLFFLAVFTVLSLGFYWSLDFETQKLYPFEKGSAIQLGISHEEIPSNWSEGKYEIDQDSIIHFKYALSRAVQEPFVGLYLHRQDSIHDLFMDFSHFDQLSLHLKAEQGSRIPVFLTLDYKGFTKSGKALSWLPLSAVAQYKGEGVYALNKSDFEIPSWWLRMHNMKKEDFSALDFSRVTYLVVNSCQALGAGRKDEIQISSIYFSHDNQHLYIAYAFSLLAILIMMILVYFIHKKKVLVPYQVHVIDQQNSHSKLDQIKSYMAQHYSNPELSAQDLQQAIGVTEREIGLLIKNNLDSSFKSYLNIIRLAEVKRLLLHTHKPVSDIAYLTGYNNIPHFNRVFKKEFDCTPKEFRLANK